MFPLVVSDINKKAHLRNSVFVVHKSRGDVYAMVLGGEHGFTLKSLFRFLYCCFSHGREKRQNDWVLLP